VNPNGYTTRTTGRFERGFPPWRKRKQFEFTLDESGPLTLCCVCDGFEFYAQPDRHGLTDFGSIPEWFRGIVSETYAPASFIIHDSACREHGLYFAPTMLGPFKFQGMCSPAVHRLLRLCVVAERENRPMAGLIWAAVRTGGPRF